MEVEETILIDGPYITVYSDKIEYDSRYMSLQTSGQFEWKHRPESPELKQKAM